MEITKQIIYDTTENFILIVQTAKPIQKIQHFTLGAVFRHVARMNDNVGFWQIV